MLQIIQRILNIFNVSIVERSLAVEKYDYTNNIIFIKQTDTGYTIPFDQDSGILVQNSGPERVNSIELS